MDNVLADALVKEIKKQENILMRAASVNQCRTNVLTQADALGVLLKHRGWSYVKKGVIYEI